MRRFHSGARQYSRQRGRSFQEWQPPLSMSPGLQLPPDSPRIFSRSVGRSHPGSYKSSASSIGSGACENLYVLFKSEVPTPHHPLAVPKVNPAGHQSQMFGGGGACVHADPMGWGASRGAQNSLLREKPCSVNILQFVGCLPECMGLDCIAGPSLLPVLLWFFIFRCGRYSLVDSGLFQ